MGIGGDVQVFRVFQVAGDQEQGEAQLATNSSAVIAAKKPDLKAADVAGGSKLGILFRHIVPNGMGPVLSNSVLQMAQAVLTEASLSFLGLGDPNQASWGLILNAGQRNISTAPWLVIAPGVALALLLLPAPDTQEGR